VRCVCEVGCDLSYALSSHVQGMNAFTRACAWCLGVHECQARSAQLGMC
jgi:hypothetical protein